MSSRRLVSLTCVGLTLTEFVTLMASTRAGGPTEDTSGGFQQGGWLAPFFDEALGENMNRTFGEWTPWFLAQIDTRPGKPRASLATFE